MDKTFEIVYRFSKKLPPLRRGFGGGYPLPQKNIKQIVQNLLKDSSICGVACGVFRLLIQG